MKKHVLLANDTPSLTGCAFVTFAILIPCLIAKLSFNFLFLSRAINSLKVNVFNMSTIHLSGAAYSWFQDNCVTYHLY